MIAYRGDHTRFEAPPLADGRRLRGDGEVEVGVGLADALGLRPGATLAVQTAGGDEVRFRVSGVVRALEHDGRIAYVRPRRLLDARPDVGSTISVRLEPGADRERVEQRAGGARRAAAAGRRRDDPQRRLPRRAGDRAARSRARRRARLPLRADPGARDDGARPPRRRRGAARLRRRRPHRRDRARRAPRSPSRCRRRSPACCSSGSCSARWSHAWQRASRACRSRRRRARPRCVLGGIAALAAAATAVVARRTMREPVIEGLREE